MNMSNSLRLTMLLCLITFTAFGQKIKIDTIQKKKNSSINYKSLIIPTALIGYGVIGIENDGLKRINSEIREEVIKNIDNKFTIDDYSQYVPFLSVYGLNAIGDKGKNNFKDRTVILGTAYLIMGTTVASMKKFTAIERPDGSNNYSFPSGHTATAFMGAEFLYQEYKDVSIWYGISGYLVATGTGFFRIYNNKHWLTDVVTGAGIGILSTKIAYWIHPFIKRTIFKNKERFTGMIMPFFNGKEAGLAMSLSL